VPAPGIGGDGGAEPAQPAAVQPQPGDLDAGARHTIGSASRQAVDVVEDLLLVRHQHVALHTMSVGEHDHLVIDGGDAQPAAGGEVEQRRHGGVGRDDEPVGEQAGDRRGL
jgi:hypothetical protein